MKKLFLFVAAVAMSIAASAATDIWTGSKHVSWSDGGIQIAATQFANAKAGDKIVVTFAEATDGIEFKVMNQYFDHLAGSREAAWISGAGTFEQFLTKSAVDSLKAYGLEIIGANFTCSKIELKDGKELKDGFTVWTGFFWADEWKTLELYWNGYAGVDWNKVTAIRFYSEAANGNYTLNFLEGWDEGQKFADQTNMVDGAGYKELTITEDLRSRLANAGRWMIQYNKEALEAFNATDVVLVGDFTTAIDNTVMESKATKTFENGQLVIIKNGVKYNALGAEMK